MARFWDSKGNENKKETEKYRLLANQLSENQKDVLLFYNDTINYQGTIKQAVEASFSLSPEELYKITKELEDMGLVDALKSYNAYLVSSFMGYIEPRTTPKGRAVVNVIRNSNDDTNEKKQGGTMRKIFIGSSTNGIKRAEVLKEHLVEKASEPIDCTVWNEKSLFKLSYATIDSLIRIAEDLKENKGYAVLLFTPDDEVTMNKCNSSKESIHLIPRDNVVFEMGLFLGVLGREHVICVRPGNVELRIFSDWKGMTDVLYKYQKNYIERCMSIPAQKIIDEIENTATKEESIDSEEDNKATVIRRSELGV